MSFQMTITLTIPDQDCPTALTAEQQDVIDRFRRDIVGASDAVVSVRPLGADASASDAIFACGSVAHDVAP